MEKDIVGGALAFAAGAGLALVNYLFSCRVLKKTPDKYVAAHVAKQAVQVLFLAALLVLGPHTPWDTVWLLAGGCLGLTAPMLWFTPRLVRLNGALRDKREKEDIDHG